MFWNCFQLKISIKIFVDIRQKASSHYSKGTKHHFPPPAESRAENWTESPWNPIAQGIILLLLPGFHHASSSPGALLYRKKLLFEVNLLTQYFPLFQVLWQKAFSFKIKICGDGGVYTALHGSIHIIHFLASFEDATITLICSLLLFSWLLSASGGVAGCL